MLSLHAVLSAVLKHMHLSKACQGSDILPPLSECSGILIQHVKKTDDESISKRMPQSAGATVISPAAKNGLVLRCCLFAVP